MAESASAKDLSTTALGLIAAYFVPGAIALGAVAWRCPAVMDFFLQDGEHFTLAAATSLSIGLLLNGLRTAVFSRWLFSDMSYTRADFKDFGKDNIAQIQAVIDEVFRLHQFYSAMLFLIPFIAWVWLTKNPIGIPALVIVVVCLLVWKVIAICVVESYELYHLIAMGMLNKSVPGRPYGYKAWVILILLEWPFSRVASGSLDAGLRKTTVVLSADQILAMNGVPVNIIPAPVPGQFIAIDQFVVQMKPGNTQFTHGGQVMFQYHGTTRPLGSNLPAATINAAYPSNNVLAPPTATYQPPEVTGVEITNDTAAFADGNGTMIITALYSIINMR